MVLPILLLWLCSLAKFEGVCSKRSFSDTYSFSVDRMHGEQQRGDKSQSAVFKDAAFARVHEQAGHGAVQTHVDHVEVERLSAVQQDVQPVTQRGVEYIQNSAQHLILMNNREVKIKKHSKTNC